MKKLKTTKGITLIALIITVIVLLILAGVSINMVIGENGLINKAQSAVDTYQNSATEEQVFLNEIENYIAGGLANIDSIGGKKDTLAPKQFTPTVTATETSITITGNTEDEEETEVSLSSGIKEYWFSKDNGATWQTNENRLATSYIYTGLSGTEEFSLKMKAIDNAGNERITETVTVKLEGAKIKLLNGSTMTLTEGNKKDYYGLKVNYSSPTAATWRIFYVDTKGKYGDKNTIYLKADYINGNNTSLGSTYTDTTVLEKMNPEWWKYRGNNSGSWSRHELAAAWLCDPNNWNAKYKGIGAKWSIAGPSIEMFIDSYNDIYGANSLNYAYATSDYPGYKLGSGGSATLYYTGASAFNQGPKGIYCVTQSEWWLASPSTYHPQYPRCCIAVSSNRSLDGVSYYDSCALCPLVCLETNVIPEILQE